MMFDKAVLLAFIASASASKLTGPRVLRMSMSMGKKSGKGSKSGKSATAPDLCQVCPGAVLYSGGSGKGGGGRGRSGGKRGKNASCDESIIPCASTVSKAHFHVGLFGQFAVR